MRDAIGELAELSRANADPSEKDWDMEMEECKTCPFYRDEHCCLAPKRLKKPETGLCAHHPMNRQKVESMLLKEHQLYHEAMDRYEQSPDTNNA